MEVKDRYNSDGDDGGRWNKTSEIGKKTNKRLCFRELLGVQRCRTRKTLAGIRTVFLIYAFLREYTGCILALVFIIM